LRIFGIELIENSETQQEAILFVFNEDKDFFTSDGFLHFAEDTQAGTNILSSFNKNNIVFLKGEYPVVFDETTGYFYSLVNAILN
jgi:hypothetical protein